MASSAACAEDAGGDRRSARMDTIAAFKEVKTMDTTTTIAALIQQGMDANPEATRAVLMGIQLGFSLAALETTKKAG